MLLNPTDDHGSPGIALTLNLLNGFHLRDTQLCYTEDISTWQEFVFDMPYYKVTFGYVIFLGKVQRIIVHSVRCSSCVVECLRMIGYGRYKPTCEPWVPSDEVRDCINCAFP
jgi:hypothetical protein